MTDDPQDGTDPAPAPTDAFELAPPEPVDPGEAAASPDQRPRRAGVAGLVLAALFGGLLAVGSLAALGQVGRSAPTPAPSSTPGPGVEGNAVGAPGAPVTIEIWADYQCPYCRLETVIFGATLERQYALTGKARIVYRDFAFLGQESLDAAVAARCAGQQAPEAYWRYHDLLFAAQQGENQGTFSRANLVILGTIAGLDVTRLGTCLDDPSIPAAVRSETQVGRTLGITSTPTLRISGPGGVRVLTGFTQQWSTLVDAIDAATSPTPSGTPSPSGSPGSGSSSATPAASTPSSPASGASSGPSATP